MPMAAGTLGDLARSMSEAQSDLNERNSLASLGPYWLAGCFILLAVPTLVLYADLPIVRNALVYARIADFMIEHGGEFSVAEHAYNKAIGFPALSLPMVAALGGNFGLKVASFVWSSLWLLSVAFFLARLKRVFVWDAGPSPSTALCLAVFFVNPLVYYQFVSAYPDSLNALVFVWSMVFLERMTSRDARTFDGVMFFALLVLSIWIKHHGFVLFALLVIFSLCRISNLSWQWRNVRPALLASGAGLCVSLVIIGLAQTGYLEIFNMSQNRGNYGGGFDRIGIIVKRNLGFIENYLWLSFTILIPFLLRWKSFWKYKEWYLSIVFFIATILVYEGSRYNLRYYLPIAPLLAWIICNNLVRIPRRLAVVLLVVFFASNAFFTAYYNNIAVAMAVSRTHTLPFRDNLRLIKEQRFQRNHIAAINAEVGPQTNVLFLSLPYYRGAGFYIWERAGLFAPELEIEYMDEPNWKFITDFATKHRLRKALYFGVVAKTAREQWEARVSWKRLTSKSYVLSFICLSDLLSYQSVIGKRPTLDSSAGQK